MLSIKVSIYSKKLHAIFDVMCIVTEKRSLNTRKLIFLKGVTKIFMA
jgi:hypothetical protein